MIMLLKYLSYFNIQQRTLQMLSKQISKISKTVKKKKFTFTKTTKNIKDQKKESEYVLLPKWSIKQLETCYAIAINNINTLCIVAMCSIIKIIQLPYIQSKSNYELLENKPECIQLQILEGIHTNIVSTLNFMQNTENYDKFISGSFDGRIVIWSPHKLVESQIQQKQWSAQFILLGHASYVNCLILQNDESFISGSSDKTIKVWKYHKMKNEWSCTQTICEHTDIVLGLSISEDNKQLISCGGEKKIIIMKSTSNGKFQLCQKIQVDVGGSRIIFITNELFMFLQESSTHLHIYKATRKGIYERYQEFPVSGGEQNCDYYFPALYIKPQNLLVLKNGRCVNLINISINLNNLGQLIQCNLEQVIMFGKLEVLGTYGTMSNNGKLLVTWNSTSNQIQFRILKYWNEKNQNI
ncbi:unnamed protein product (macronuclear) [Paramecium tetraurelia]|uniref:WD repeat-containing protein 75 second beta-propeller domain-containing protein n=1 Tax=Paramecium tetraurelia TaxID=5888 RepID=A0EGR0_PARTE|nr:uncharacterized protein GSPATT00026825001 [Paramecium tetraurelia]CAK94501.1 unnamed protein product [Paramecium tetraurelia]|eukprot:XP_001461874.1 hypothetical protein (macronuclear) [Paramecium tetraurelia strain d4-2]